MSLVAGKPGSADLTLEQRILLDSEDGAGEYLRSTWFYRAMEAIRDARIANGLTQQEVANRIGTTQSAVARLENAHRGNFSLDRFLAYAWACGVAPLDLELLPTDELRRFAADDPGTPQTERTYCAWTAREGRTPWQPQCA